MEEKPQTTVLVVDDEYLIRAAVVALLEDEGFTVHEADTADSAFVVLENHPEISVLFTDINMPGSLDGFQLAHRVHEAHPHMQIILTSGRNRLKVSDAPPGGKFIEKPYSASDVIKLIRAVSTQ